MAHLLSGVATPAYFNHHQNISALAYAPPDPLSYSRPPSAENPKPACQRLSNLESSFEAPK